LQKLHHVCSHACQVKVLWVRRYWRTHYHSSAAALWLWRGTMQHEEVTQVLSRKKRNGQTLVEFALTLPILLVLLFGIIEFGRIFQAWVTLQNSARAAARYATTGQYNQNIYALNTNGADDANSHVPCIRGTGSAAERGIQAVLMPNNPANTQNHVQIFERGTEMLFATWYSGDDCNPQIDEDQNRRKDIVRILSIIAEARDGAPGLAIGSIPYLATPAPQGSAAYDAMTVANWRQVPWFHVWDRPIASGGFENTRLAGSDQPTWFDVMICSARVKLVSDNGSYVNVDESSQRFRTILEESAAAGSRERALAPACLLDEEPAATLGWTANNSRPWLDAGGPGDVITIVITFNHPLITPLGLANYLPLQARRTAVNEAFRTSRAANLGQALPTNETDVEQIDEDPPTETPVDPTETPTATNTLIPTLVSTPTPLPSFTCTGFTVTFLGFQGQNARFAIFNPNIQGTTLKRTNIQWRTLTGWNGMAIKAAYLQNGVMWTGFDTAPSLDIGNGGSDGAFILNANTTIWGNSAANGSPVYHVTFENAPSPLSSAYRADYFNNSRFYIDHPDQTADCEIVFTTTVPTNTPVVANPSATPLPDCVPGLISVRWGGFESFGVVRWTVTNRRSVAANFVGFNLAWVQRTSNFTMDALWIDGFPGTSGSVQIWRASSATQDSTPPTRGKSGSAPASVPAGEGTWLRDYVIPAGGERSFYFDFGGTSAALNNSAMNATPQDYTGTQFYFGSPLCPLEGNGTGLTGSETVGVIIPLPTPPPPPPPPPPPSNPPPPTSPPPVSPPPTSPPPVSPPPTSPPPVSPPPPPPPPPPGGGPGGGGSSDKRS
jgi:hypothetical protein